MEIDGELKYQQRYRYHGDGLMYGRANACHWVLRLWNSKTRFVVLSMLPIIIVITNWPSGTYTVAVIPRKDLQYTTNWYVDILVA